MEILQLCLPAIYQMWGEAIFFHTNESLLISYLAYFF